MKKFKAIMLGVLSALTLGLFVVTGTRVNAADTHTVESSTTTRSSYVTGDTYILNASTILADYNSDSFKLDGKSGSTTSKYYGIFYINGTKWIRKNSNNNLVSNGNGSNEDERCQINVVINKNQKVDFTVNAITNGGSATTGIYVNNYSNISNAFVTGADCSGWTGVNKTASFTANADNTTVSIWFDGKMGFNSISATINDVVIYSVGFDSKGGTSVASQNIVSGEKVTKPSDPTKSGSSFAGWFTKDGSESGDWGNEWNFSTNTVSGSMTLYAKWNEANTANITFKSSSYSSDIVVQAVDGTPSSWPNNPIKAGYVFNGWYNGETKYTNSDTFDSDITLTASFTQSVLSNGKYDVDLTDFTSDTTLVLNGTNSLFFVERLQSNKLYYGSSRLNIAGNGSKDTANYLGFNLPANSYAVVTFEAAKASDDTSICVECSNKVTFNLTSTDSSTFTAVVYNNSDSVSTACIYRGTAKSVYVYSLSVTVCSAVSTNIESQCSNDASAVRFIATVSNVASTDVITSWNYTLSMTGKSDYTPTTSQNVIYTSIAGNNGKTKTANTYYLVVTVKNIPSSYIGSELKCKMTITLSNGTPIYTDIKSETIAVSANE